MLRKIRLLTATVMFTAVTLLFLDFTGIAHKWLAWTAQVQFQPALLAVNVAVVLGLIVITWLLGRVYCSVICPMGVMQDIIAWLGRRRKKKRKKPYGFSQEKRKLRLWSLAAFVVLYACGLNAIASIVAPYSAYGRIAANLFAPLYRWMNNGLAAMAERMDSYAFYETDVWIKSLPTLVVAAVMFIVIAVLAWRGGRTYCNTICPVGTILGFLSRHSLFRISIDESKCNSCGKCGRKCKASCIDSKNHAIDYSRCVACMDCIDNCKHGAIRFKYAKSTPKNESGNGSDGNGRRAFITTTATVAATAAIRAESKKVDGGLAVVEDKVAPKRATHIVPPGAFSAHHFARHCTSCQLCVSACPNGVLMPSGDFERLMQPEMSYERGYCRTECTRCADVCPTDAIRPITVEEKSSTRIGHAVWVKKNCIPLTDGVECGNCARHCPSGAIQMVPMDANDEESLKIPVVNTERCIGCGACEHLCPARPFSAIYVEGHERHSNY